MLLILALLCDMREGGERNKDILFNITLGYVGYVNLYGVHLISWICSFPLDRTIEDCTGGAFPYQNPIISGVLQNSVLSLHTSSYTSKIYLSSPPATLTTLTKVMLPSILPQSAAFKCHPCKT